MAEEWFETWKKDKSESHQKRTKANIEKFLNPKFGKAPVEEI